MLTRFLDIKNGRWAASLTDASAGASPKFFRGDDRRVLLYLVTPSGGTPYYDSVSPSSMSIRYEIGELDDAPASGDFSLTFGADTSANLAISASASDVASAINKLTGITTAGGVSVTGSDGVFAVTFASAGARDLITGASISLVPAGVVETTRLVIGDANTREVQQIRVLRDAYIRATDATTYAPTATLTVETQGTASISETHSLVFPSESTGGIVTLTPVSNAASSGITATAGADMTQAEFQAALDTLYGASNTVATRIKSGSFRWTFCGTLAKTAIGTETVDSSALAVPAGILLTLGINTNALAYAFSEASSSSLSLTSEIELTTDTETITALQETVTVYRDLIRNASVSLASASEYVTKSEAAALYLSRSLNLSDLANVVTALTNLGVKIYEGVGTTISGATINASGHLVLSTSDGTEIDCGEAKGSDGSAGVSVSSATVNASGHLILTLSDASTVDCGNVVGATGETGSTGAAGTNGVSVTGAAINSSGHLVLTLSDSSTIDAGSVQASNDYTRGRVALDGTSETVTVSGLALASAPTVVFCSVATSDGSAIFAAPLVSSYATTGFVANLSAIPPSGSYLNYLLFL